MSIYQTNLFNDNESSIKLFRFGLCVFLAGISLIFFVCCRLIHSQFDILNYSLSTSFGFIAGMGLICFPYESLNALSFRSLYFLVSISLSIVILILADFCWIEEPFSYVPVPSGLDNDEARKSTDEHHSSFPISSLEIDDRRNEEVESLSIQKKSAISLSMKKLQLYMHIIMVIFFWNDMLRCAVISPQKNLYRDLMRLVTQKLSFSICIPSFLEDSQVTDRKFFLYMIICSMSSPLGVTLAVFLPTRSVAALTAFSNRWFCSCSAGLMIYASLTYILPRVLQAHEVSSYQDHQAFRRLKFIQMIAFLVGYLTTVTPYLLNY